MELLPGLPASDSIFFGSSQRFLQTAASVPQKDIFDIESLYSYPSVLCIPQYLTVTYTVILFLFADSCNELVVQNVRALSSHT